MELSRLHRTLPERRLYMPIIPQHPLPENPPAAWAIGLAAAPAWVRPWLHACLVPLFAAVSAAVYRAALARSARHPLVRLATAYDPAPVVAAAAAYRHATGPGAPATYSLPTLVRA